MSLSPYDYQLFVVWRVWCDCAIVMCWYICGYIELPANELLCQDNFFTNILSTNIVHILIFTARLVPLILAPYFFQFVIKDMWFCCGQPYTNHSLWHLWKEKQILISYPTELCGMQLLIHAWYDCAKVLLYLPPQNDNINIKKRDHAFL